MIDKWPRIKNKLLSRLSDLTEELESPSLDDRQTMLIRGQIIAIREALDIGERETLTEETPLSII